MQMATSITVSSGKIVVDFDGTSFLQASSMTVICAHKASRLASGEGRARSHISRVDPQPSDAAPSPNNAENTYRLAVGLP
jgi:hypothetical protein